VYWDDVIDNVLAIYEPVQTQRQTNCDSETAKTGSLAPALLSLSS